MIVSLPWAFGWFRRDAHKPPAYLNILLTLLAVVHGSLVLRDVMLTGPALIQVPWLSVADLNLEIGSLVAPGGEHPERTRQAAMVYPTGAAKQDLIVFILDNLADF